MLVGVPSVAQLAAHIKMDGLRVNNFLRHLPPFPSLRHTVYALRTMLSHYLVLVLQYSAFLSCEPCILLFFIAKYEVICPEYIC